MDAHELPQISAMYESTIGIYVFAIYKLNSEIQLLRKKIDTMRYLINIEQFGKDIEEYVENEEAILTEKIKEWEKSILSSLEYNNLKSVTPEEMKELKTMYHYIITRIHPDLNPDFNEKNAKLYNIAVNAYKKADFNELYAVKMLIDDHSTQNLPKDVDEIKQQIIAYKKSINDLQIYISSKKALAVYGKLDLLTDKDKLRKAIDKYKEEIAEREDDLAFYQQKYDLTLAEYKSYGSTIN
jgi:hypothetical protein